MHKRAGVPSMQTQACAYRTLGIRHRILGMRYRTLGIRYRTLGIRMPSTLMLRMPIVREKFEISPFFLLKKRGGIQIWQRLLIARPERIGARNW